MQRKAKYELPATYHREIGRIIVRWAYYEHYMQRLLWAVAFAADAKGAALGRLAVREGKPEEQLSLLSSLSELRRITFDDAVFKRLKPRAPQVAEKRNLIAHGLWTDPEGGGWAVQQTRGAWESSTDGPRGKKKITPEGVIMKLEDLRAIGADVESLIVDAAALKNSLRDIPTS